EVYKVPVIVINDCVAAAWGEYVLSRRGVSNLLYVTISSGIGGGVVVDGNLLLGKSGNAHEIGHMVVDHTSEVVCGCGGRGHWEALAGGANVPKVARIKALKWKGKETRALQLAKTGSLDAPLLYSLARNGDQFAISLVNEMNRVHSAGLASAIAAYDPEVVVLGGGVVLNNQDLMLRPIAERLKEYLSLSLPSLEVSGFGDNAVLYGALAIALRPPKSLEAFGKV
ncbi:MAG: ROK family protein, partial [Acidilobaceae archaeon]